MYSVYILLCRDGSYYTGITNDLQKRLRAHKAGTASRYTRARGAVRFAYTEHKRTRGTALKREYEIKQMTRAQKRMLMRQVGENVKIR